LTLVEVVSKEGKNWSKILTALQRNKHIFLQIEGDEYYKLGEVYSAMRKTFKTGYPGATVSFFTLLNLYISGKLIAAQL
jgi:hypothetical protein